VVDQHALGPDAGVVLDDVEDEAGALELVLEVRRVDEDELTGARGALSLKRTTCFGGAIPANTSAEVGSSVAATSSMQASKRSRSAIAASVQTISAKLRVASGNWAEVIAALGITYGFGALGARSAALPKSDSPGRTTQLAPNTV
jgi:hypothetical protein